MAKDKGRIRDREQANMHFVRKNVFGLRTHDNTNHICYYRFHRLFLSSTAPLALHMQYSFELPQARNFILFLMSHENIISQQERLKNCGLTNKANIDIAFTFFSSSSS